MVLSHQKVGSINQHTDSILSTATEGIVTASDFSQPWSPQVQLSAKNLTEFGQQPMSATHNLHQADLFSDAALIELLDNFPRQHLYALTMGSDPRQTEGNRLALQDGVSGSDLLRAVKRGRLWLNITRIDRVDARYRALIDRLYEQLSTEVPGFSPLASQGTLLISSPHVMVYYHADAPATLLWHIRGRKRVWVYPALDSRYMQRDHLEDIYAGTRHEYLPYTQSYDHGAVIYDLEPGQLLAWPLNAPHRVTNLDSVNVSLTTEHFTTQSRQRARVYNANHFLRTRLGLRNLSCRESGIATQVKTLFHRTAYKLGIGHMQTRRHIATLRVDPDAPEGVIALETNESIAATGSARASL